MKLPASIALGVAALALTAGCSVPADVSSLADTASSATSSGPYRFEVTGKGTATNVTWGVNGNQSQAAKAKLPWVKEVPADGFAVASLVAQNGGSGSITCRITRDGEIVAEQTSEGQYSVATCSG